MKMGNNNRIWTSSVLLLVVCSLAASMGDHEDYERRRESDEKWPFLLRDSKHVVKTDAGDMRIVRGFASKYMRSNIHIGLIKMDPRSLFIPQYLDSSLLLFIHCGEARVGHIHKDELVEKSLKMGDIYRIEAGSAFYLINEEEGRSLHVICNIDTSESLGWHIQAFFIAGGTDPVSVLSGFDHSTLSSAFNVSESELKQMFTRQSHGPIVHLSNSHSPSVWSKFLDMEHHHKLAHMKRVVQSRQEDHVDEGEEEKQEKPTWSFRKLLFSVFGNAYEMRDDRERIKTNDGPDSYNIYDRKPDFQNDYGWTIALDGSDYSPLTHDDVGVYLVNISGGSMMAPHMNPRATEYGIVLRGSGCIQIVYPNGSLAMKAEVRQGDVFWVPRYFPFCQIATGPGPFEFFGFTTSARDNKAQFLVGANSVLHEMRGPEFESAFEMSKGRLKEIINAQTEEVILPMAAVARPDGVVEKEEMMIRSLSDEMIMQFD